MILAGRWKSSTVTISKGISWLVPIEEVRHSTVVDGFSPLALVWPFGQGLRAALGSTKSSRDPSTWKDSVAGPASTFWCRGGISKLPARG